MNLVICSLLQITSQCNLYRIIKIKTGLPYWMPSNITSSYFFTSMFKCSHVMMKQAFDSILLLFPKTSLQRLFTYLQSSVCGSTSFVLCRCSGAGSLGLKVVLSVLVIWTHMRMFIICHHYFSTDMHCAGRLLSYTNHQTRLQSMSITAAKY